MEPPPTVRAPRRWLRGRRLVVVVLALAIAAAGIGTGLLYRQHLALSEVDSARRAALDAAKQKAVEVLSYDYRNWDKDLAAAKADLTGQFKQDFGTLAAQLVGPTAKAKSVVTEASVSAASVIRADADQVVVLLFINQQTGSSERKRGQVNASRVRVTLDNVDGAWLISNMEPV